MTDRYSRRSAGRLARLTVEAVGGLKDQGGFDKADEEAEG